MIQQSPWRRDDDLAAVAQSTLLRGIVHTTDDGDSAQPNVVAECEHLLVDLHRQLARRRQDQRPAAGIAAPLQALQNGKHEGGGLAGPGRRTTDQVTTGENDRYGLRLDRRRVRVAHVSHRLGQRRNQIELIFFLCHCVSRFAHDVERGREGGEADCEPRAARCESDDPRGVQDREQRNVVIELPFR